MSVFVATSDIRMFFYAEPKDDPPPEIPKDWSDRESNAAKFVSFLTPSPRLFELIFLVDG